MYYTDEKAEKLCKLYSQHVRHPDGHWKGFAEAEVPFDIADDVAEAMGYHGSIVDFRAVNEAAGTVILTSQGYWAHGF